MQPDEDFDLDDGYCPYCGAPPDEECDWDCETWDDEDFDDV